MGYFLAAFALVAQLDRALASGAKGCGFDPRRAQYSKSPQTAKRSRSVLSVEVAKLAVELAKLSGPNATLEHCLGDAITLIMQSGVAKKDTSKCLSSAVHHIGELHEMSRVRNRPP